MQIQAGDDRHVRSDRLSQAGEQLAVGVFEMLGDHGTVQIEEQAVEGKRRGDRANETPRYVFEGVLGDMGRGKGGAPECRNKRPAPPLGFLDEAANRHIDVSGRLDDSVALQKRRPEVAMLEGAKISHRRREGVGFVQEAADGNAR